MSKRNLPVKIDPTFRQLPPPGPETCMVCMALTNLDIRNFNSFPGNCPARLKNVWCTFLYLNNQ